MTDFALGARPNSRGLNWDEAAAGRNADGFFCCGIGAGDPWQ